jgi:hypothetical protein
MSELFHGEHRIRVEHDLPARPSSEDWVATLLGAPDFDDDGLVNHVPQAWGKTASEAFEKLVEQLG